MRKFVIFSLWLSMPFSTLMGQSVNYFPIFTNSTQWNLFVSNNGAIDMGFQKVTKDTLIGGQFFSVFAADGLHPQKSTAYLFEDTNARKVYVMEDGNTRLLYDFTLKKGDKFEFKEDKFEVIAVGKIPTREGDATQITLKCVNKLADFLVWIEGVGSTVSPLYYKHYGKSSLDVKVKCFFRRSELIYSLSDEVCPTPTQTSFAESALLGIQVFPTPTINDLTIHVKNSENQAFEMELLSISGVSLNKKQILSQGEDFSLNWDMQSLESGMYLLHIRSSNGSMITKKIIKS